MSTVDTATRPPDWVRQVTRPALEDLFGAMTVGAESPTSDARFLRDQRLGGILAADMGLEKTLQTLTMAERDRNNGTPGPAAPVLVLAPTSVVATWARESRRMSDLQER